MAGTLIYNNCYTATIIAAAPEIGAAIIMPTEGAEGVGKHVIAYYPVLDTAYGVSQMPLYPTGSTVMCARGYMNNESVVFIIGQVNNTMDPRDNSSGPRMLYNAEKFTQSCLPVMSGLRLLERLCGNQSSSWIRNHANGISADSLPGDYDISDKQTALGLHIGKYMAQLRGSAIAFVDVSSLTSRVRLVGESVEEHNRCMERVRTSLYKVDNQAADVSEAFGVPAGSAVDADSGNETLTDDFAIPLYRIQHVSGALAQGFEDLVVGWPMVHGDGLQPVQRHDDTTEPPMLARRRMDFNGETSSASAHSLMSVKTPWIQGIEQLGYGGLPKEPDPEGAHVFDDLRTPHDASISPNTEPDIPEADDDDAITNAAINKMVDKLLTGSYKEAMLKALRDHGFAVTSSQGSLTGEPVDVELPGGATPDQQYKLPEHVDITDPATGRTQRYYSSMSFITQERDGSICICDGYGSEIRMCRGNIYISPALDLILRPGRDFSVMAPGHLALNAQGSVTINSSDSMFIRAVNNLKVVGATSGTGVVTVESRAVKGPQDTALPGLVIRSDSNLSMTAVNDMYIGRNSNKGDGHEKATAPEAEGSVVLDAGGNGGVYARCKSITVDAGELTAGAFTMQPDEASGAIQGTAITMTQNSVGIYADYITMPATLNMKSMEDVVKATLCRGGKRREARLNTSSKPSIWLQDSMVIGQDLIVNGQGRFNGHGKRGHALHAYGVISTTDDAELAPKARSTKRHFEEQELPPTQANAAPASAVAPAAASNAARRSYQDWFITGNQFAFPKTYNVSMPIVPGMVWQERTKGNTPEWMPWKEVYMDDGKGNITACYPGYDIWENAVVTARGDKRDYKKLNAGGYVTNAEHKEV